MWTGWHLAYTHTQHQAVLSHHLSLPLDVPHGQQPSEHGNDPGRPANRSSVAAAGRQVVAAASRSAHTPPPLSNLKRSPVQ